MKIVYLLLIIVFFISCGGSNNQDEAEIIVIKDEPLFYEQWYINHDEDFYTKNDIDTNAHINVKDNLKKYTGKGIKVAIIDDGFDTNHIEISNKIIAKVAIDSYGNVIGDDVSHTSNNEFHGTAVTGIIASSINGVGIRGVAPDVELILIKMPEDFDDIAEIELFKQAVDFGADIINCSWGTNDVSDTVRDYVNDISNNARDGKGVIIVFASGNDDESNPNDESAIKNVISVGATNKNNLRTYYSNYGTSLDIVAPGGEYLGISTIDPQDTNGISDDSYNRYNQYNNGYEVSFIGTSAAAPIMTGVLALALQINKNITRQELQNILKYSTNTIGQNTPYLDDMIESSSQRPKITGLLGTSSNSQIQIKFKSKNTYKTFGPFDITINGDNTFSSTPSIDLDYGEYIIEIIDINDLIVWASDEEFKICITCDNKTNKQIRKSDFYGYGKINLDKLLNNL